MDWRNHKVNMDLLIILILFSCIAGVLGLAFYSVNKIAIKDGYDGKPHRWVVFDLITQIPLTPPCVNKQLTDCGITVSKCEKAKESMEFACLTNIVVVDLAE